MDDFQAFLDGGARTRPAGDDRAGHESHLRSASLVSSARKAPRGSPERDFYVWSDTDDKYKTPASSSPTPRNPTGPGIRVAKAYFWHRFFSHQPDLNFDNPRVVEEMLNVMRFWLDMGVDALRLDAIPYLVERDGTNCENLPETHALIKTSAAGDRRRIMPTACFWRKPISGPPTCAPISATATNATWRFHFPLMPRIYMALRQEDRLPITDIMAQTPSIPGDLPVGPVPAQPRRADARNGDQRRARLHVPGLQRRPAHAHQSRHPPPPGAARWTTTAAASNC